MKKLITLCFFSFCMIAVAYAETPSAVLKAFNSSFHDVQNTKWFESGENYVVHFDHNGLSIVVTYDKWGTLLASKRISDKETLLPLHILHSVKQKYADKSITLVTEKFDEGVTTYNIQVQNEKQIITLSSSIDGNLAVIDKINK